MEIIMAVGGVLCFMVLIAPAIWALCKLWDMYMDAAHAESSYVSHLQKENHTLRMKLFIGQPVKSDTKKGE